MKLVNRGFIIVRPTAEFWNWANSFDDDLEFSVEDGVEPNVYLIEDDFFEIEPVIEQNFKKIFKNELSMISDEEEDWPEERTLEDFYKWFEVEAGTTVFDLLKEDLRSEKV